MHSPRYVFGEMTGPELERALPSIQYAILPVGAMEQHGPGGTFAVDSARGEGFARLLAERLYPQVLAVPVVPFGYSHHHMPFPGTITLEADTLIAVVEDLVVGLRRLGIRRFVLINAHGGNKDALEIAARDLRDAYPDLWVKVIAISGVVNDIRQPKEIESPLMGHACQRELSQSLYLAPWTVRPSAAAPAELTEQAVTRYRAPVKIGRTYDEVTRNGCLGDARHASAEFGRLLIETAADRVAAELLESLG